MVTINNEKGKLHKKVNELDERLRKIALTIHENPELGYKEYKAVELLTNLLKSEGFTVEKNIVDLETAFVATYTGEGKGPTIGLLCEYDALPKLGHACGHNLIGTSSVGAAIALKKFYGKKLSGTIKVIGTPAEEGLGGKVIMSDKGVFDDLDVAMMCHPKNKTMVLRGGLARVAATFKFYGKESHASSAPEEGISALDATINSFVAINSLRQFFTDDVRVHGIITKGGEAANIVPGFCEAKFLIRASTRERVQEVKNKVYRAVKNSASAVGSISEVEEGFVYAERNNNVAMARMFQSNLESMGIEVSPPPQQGGVGSSDIGNVGQIVPTIHPYIKIGEATNHTPGFAEEAKSENAMVFLNKAATALAMTSYDLFEDSKKLEMVKNEFIQWKKQKEEKH